MRSIISLFALTVLAASAQSRTVIQAGAVIDGRGGVHQNQQIVIDGGRIVTCLLYTSRCV